MQLPYEIQQFLTRAIVCGHRCLPQHYPDKTTFENFQSDFRYHGLTGNDLTSTAEGSFQPGWYVIATNAFGDPFIVDLNEADRHYPVYYALHDAGKWNRTPVADDLEHFAVLLTGLTKRTGQMETLQYIKTHTDLASELWQEVCADIRDNEQNTTENGAESATIHTIGSGKMHAIRYLRKHLDMNKQKEMPLAEGASMQCNRTIHRLQALGVTTVFMPI